jgi:hypothetical protein
MAESPEIKVRLTAEDQGVSAAIRQLSSELKNLKAQQDETRASSLGLGEAFSGLLQAISIYKLVEFGKGVLDSAVQIGKLHDQTGISTETLSVFHKVAEDVGVSTEKVDRALGMAAKTVTLFSAGNRQAAQAMGLLRLTTADFVGLSPDQKLEKVVTALGRMAPGFEKNTAAALLFSRQGREMINVANAIAAQGMDKARESTEELGLMLSGQMVDSARAAKASLQEVEDVGKGIATQFMAGLLPAVSDIGEALVKNSGKGGEGMVKLGGYVGYAVKVIVEGAMAIGKSIGAAVAVVVDGFEFLWNELAAGGRRTLGVLSGGLLALTGDFSDAWKAIHLGSGEAATDEANRIRAIFAGLKSDLADIDKGLFPSPEEEERRMKERVARLRTEGEGEEPGKMPGAAGEKVRAPQLLDAAARAELALALKQQQDLLAVWKAGAAERAEADKVEYERGELSLKAYFDRRRAAIQEETQKEIAVLTTERNQVQAAATAAGERAATARGAEATAASPTEKRELAGQADRETAAQLQGLARVDELNTRITEAQIRSKTQLGQLDADQFRAELSEKEKIAEFLKQIDELQHKTSAGAQEEISAKTAEMRVILEQAGYSKAAIDELLSKYARLKEAAAAFGEQEKAVQEGIRLLENQRREIQIQLKDSKISEEQAERETKALLDQQIPVLRQKAQLELQSALASGDSQKIAQAQQQIIQIQQLSEQTDRLGQIGKQVSSTLTQDFTKFFEAIPQGTRAIGQAFGQMELQVIRALMNVAAQMVVNALLQKSLDEDTRLSDAKTAAANVYKQVSAIPVVGWILAPIAAAATFAAVLAFAEGGLVAGPGGPRADRVPAVLSAGEYVVNAGAVKSFGARNLEAINAGLSPSFAASIARPGDFRTPGFALPAEVAGGSREVHNYFQEEIHLHHSGPDARQVLDDELVPRLLAARRMGALPEMP